MVAHGEHGMNRTPMTTHECRLYMSPRLSSQGYTIAVKIILILILLKKACSQTDFASSYHYCPAAGKFTPPMTSFDPSNTTIWFASREATRIGSCSFSRSYINEDIAHTANGKAVSDDEWSSEFPPSNAFEILDSDYAQNNMDLPRSLIFRYEEPRQIAAYSIQALETGGAFPLDWTFDGSSDGVTWTTLHCVRNAFNNLQIDLNRLETYTLDTSRIGFYKFYRIEVWKSSGALAISEFNMYEPACTSALVTGNQTLSISLASWPLQDEAIEAVKVSIVNTSVRPNENVDFNLFRPNENVDFYLFDGMKSIIGPSYQRNPELEYIAAHSHTLCSSFSGHEVISKIITDSCSEDHPLGLSNMDYGWRGNVWSTPVSFFHGSGPLQADTVIYNDKMSFFFGKNYGVRVQRALKLPEGEAIYISAKLEDVCSTNYGCGGQDIPSPTSSNSNCCHNSYRKHLYVNLYIEDRDQPFIFFGFDREKELWKCGSKSNIDSVDDAVANVGGTSNPDDYMTVRADVSTNTLACWVGHNVKDGIPEILDADMTVQLLTSETSGLDGNWLSHVGYLSIHKGSGWAEAGAILQDLALLVTGAKLMSANYPVVHQEIIELTSSKVSLTFQPNSAISEILDSMIITPKSAVSLESRITFCYSSSNCLLGWQDSTELHVPQNIMTEGTTVVIGSKSCAIVSISPTILHLSSASSKSVFVLRWTKTYNRVVKFSNSVLSSHWSVGNSDFTFISSVTPKFRKTSQHSSLLTYDRNDGKEGGFTLKIREDGHLTLFLHNRSSTLGYEQNILHFPTCLLGETGFYDTAEPGAELTSHLPLPVNQTTEIAWIRRGHTFELYLNGTLSCSVHTSTFWNDAKIDEGDAGNDDHHNVHLGSSLVSKDAMFAAIYSHALSTTDIKNLGIGAYTVSSLHAIMPCFSCHENVLELEVLSSMRESIYGTKTISTAAPCHNNSVEMNDVCFISSCPATEGLHSVDGSCTDCPMGSFKATEGIFCEECAPGYFGNESGLGSCKFCPLGYSQSVEGSTECQPCEPGMFSTNIGSVKCTTCEPGKYVSTAGSDECLKCPAGTHIEDASTSERHDELADCRPCPPLTYNPLQGLGTPCFPCATADTTGSINCDGCSPGFFESIIGDDNSTCLKCVPGKFTNTRNDGSCKVCVTGQYNDEEASVNCKLCERGQYGRLISSGAQNSTFGCIGCPSGKYSSASGLSSLQGCVDCNAGFYSPNIGVQEQSGCKPCTAGKYSSVFGATAQTQCMACPAGHYSVDVAATHMSACKACPMGFNQNQPGSVYCLQCQPGMFAALNKSSACTLCPFNSISKKARATNCSDCGVGKTTISAGSVFCIDCKSGRYKGSGDIHCVECPIGFMAAGPRSSNCIPCREGSYTPRVGASACTACLPGTYKFKHSKADSACEVCPLGYYNNEPYAVECVRCEIGAFTASTGSIACMLCELGRFGRRFGACEDCPRGFFQDEKRAVSCKSCPVNTYSEKLGATSMSECIACPDDRTTSNLTGASSMYMCVCKATLYYEDIGTNEQPTEESGSQSPCIPCPHGAICPFDGSDKSVLYGRPGFWQPENLTDIYVDCGGAFSDEEQAGRARMRCCPRSSCKNVPRPQDWSLDDQCEYGYSGPLCTSCRNGFLMRFGACIECEGGGTMVSGIIGLLVTSVLLFLLLSFALSERFLTDNQSEDSQSKTSRIAGLFSIIVSWLQILSALTVTYKVKWPQEFSTYSKSTGIFANLEIISFLSLTDCRLAVPFINSFLLNVLTPLAFVFSVFMAWLARRNSHKSKKKKQRARTAKAFEFCLIIINLLYPKLSTRTFQMFRCIDLGDRVGLLLDADLSKKCFEGVHATYVPLAIISSVIYLVGIPLSIYALLFRNRKRLGQLEILAKYGHLYEPYDRTWYHWECVQMIQKCLLTGAMCAIAPGSPWQLLTAIIISMGYMLLVLHAKPFRGVPEDRLAFTSSFAQCFTLVLGLALIMDEKAVEATFNRNLFGAVLICINVIPLLLLIVFSFQIAMHGANHLMDSNLSPLQGQVNRRAAKKMTRQLTIDDTRLVLTKAKVTKLEKTSQEHKNAFLSEISLRKKNATKRLQKRLSNRVCIKVKDRQVANITVAPTRKINIAHWSPQAMDTPKVVENIRQKIQKKVKSHKRFVKCFKKLGLDPEASLSKSQFYKLLHALTRDHLGAQELHETWGAVQASSQSNCINCVVLSSWLGLHVS